MSLKHSSADKKQIAASDLRFDAAYFLENHMDTLSKKAKEVCSFLDGLAIEYTIICHPPAFTIEECEKIEALINGKICKNLFLQTTSGNVKFLLMMEGSKKFVTKDVSKKLGTSRLSFATGEDMERILNTSPGSLSITSLIFDKVKSVSLAMDKDILTSEFICCHPSDNTATLKIKTSDVTDKLLPALGITPQITDI